MNPPNDMPRFGCVLEPLSDKASPTDVKVIDTTSDTKDITKNISIMDADWCFHLYNSGYSDYGLNVKFDELVELRDKLTEIIESGKMNDGSRYTSD